MHDLRPRRDALAPRSGALTAVGVEFELRLGPRTFHASARRRKERAVTEILEEIVHSKAAAATLHARGSRGPATAGSSHGDPTRDGRARLDWGRAAGARLGTSADRSNRVRSGHGPTRDERQPLESREGRPPRRTRRSPHGTASANGLLATEISAQSSSGQRRSSTPAEPGFDRAPNRHGQRSTRRATPSHGASTRNERPPRRTHRASTSRLARAASSRPRSLPNQVRDSAPSSSPAEPGFGRAPNRHGQRSAMTATSSHGASTRNERPPRRTHRAPTVRLVRAASSRQRSLPNQVRDSAAPRRQRERASVARPTDTDSARR